MLTLLLPKELQEIFVKNIRNFNRVCNISRSNNCIFGACKRYGWKWGRIKETKKYLPKEVIERSYYRFLSILNTINSYLHLFETNFCTGIAKSCFISCIRKKWFFSQKSAPYRVADPIGGKNFSPKCQNAPYRVGDPIGGTFLKKKIVFSGCSL